MSGESSGQANWMLAGLAPGSVVSGYRIESRLGAGGMAVVFRARDEGLDRIIALKVLAPGLVEDHEFRERFIRESRAAARVEHPHIIPVYGAGESNGVLYIAMRFIPGGDLRALINREGPLPADRAVFLLSPLASALDSAHEAGLIHRDVKPANILIDTSRARADHPYLSDFGLAKGSASTGLTGAGQFLGTLDYCAPEQINGKPAGPQSDQYALAGVAYTMLTGAVPFPRNETTAVLWAHIADPPPALTTLRPDLPTAADRVIARALAKAPDNRYPSCGEFVEALSTALDIGSRAFPGNGVQAAKEPGRSREDLSASVLISPSPGTTDEKTGSRSSMSAEDSRGRLVHPPTFPRGVRIEGDAAVSETVTSRSATSASDLPSTDLGPGQRTRRKKRVSRRLVIASAVTTGVLVIGGSVFGTWMYTQGQYFVAVQNGYVTLFHGVNSKFAGVSLFSSATAPTLQFSELGSADQSLVTQPVSESSVATGQSLIDRLQAHLVQCHNEWKKLVSWQEAEDIYLPYGAGSGPDPGPLPPTPDSADCAPAYAFGIPASDLPSS